MAEFNVHAETPSALAEPRVVADVDPVTISWSPERGWLCSATNHHIQPCEHTEGKTALKSILWEQ